MKRWNILDLFLVLLVVLAVLAVYCNFFHPLQFSHLIKREGVMRYGEVELLLPDELSWMAQTLPVGEESRNVYGELDWKILEVGEAAFQGRKFVKIKVRLLVTEESSGLLHYGKYTLVKGSKLFLINDHYFVEGRVLDFQILEEGIRL